jgi:hypothetical protein
MRKFQGEKREQERQKLLEKLKTNDLALSLK